MNKEQIYKNFFAQPPNPFIRQGNAPIPYLILDGDEIAQARPVPVKSPLLRSLCKGEGTLRMSTQGMVYLDIQNYFITSLMPYLRASGLAKPPYLKAHIPVILTREMSNTEISTYLGKNFSFEVEGLYSTQPKNWPEMEQVWFFKVRASELQQLRHRQLLSSRTFHIVVAVKMREEKKPLPVMRINPAFLAA